MTPERIQEARSLIVQAGTDPAVWKPASKALDELCDSALRLAAIENAGDEEVDDLFEYVRRNTGDPQVASNVVVLNAVLKSRNQVIADLRAKLGELFSAAWELSGGAERMSGSMVIKVYDFQMKKLDDILGKLQPIIAESEVEGG